MKAMITPSTRILGDATHTWEHVYAWAEQNGAARLPFLKVYLRVLYDLGDKTGVNADLAAMQSAHECGDPATGRPWRSAIWQTRGNPAGLGVTGGPDEGLAFATGTLAARAHIAHLLLYATGVIDRAGLTPADDARYDDYRTTYGTSARATTLQGLAGTWAEDLAYATGIAARARACFGVETAMPLTFGRVPHPAFQNRQITKAENVGQNNLGKRTVRGVVLHRMLGTLWGTDTWFRNPAVRGLTDYGVGVASIDGADNDGAILRYNDPLGYQSGWASGIVDRPYGDGLAFVLRYGINAVNRDQASVEISGDYETAFSEKAKNAVAALIAYWADQYKISWEAFPIAPEGFSFVRWHQEFTIGSGKICPGPVVMNATDDLIERARAIMKRYQMTEPKPEKPSFPKTGPIPPIDGTDHHFHDAVWYACERQVKVKAKTLGRFASIGTGAKKAAEDLKQGASFKAVFVVHGSRESYWITKEGYRIPMSGTGPKVLFAN